MTDDSEALIAILQGVERRLADRRKVRQTGDVFKELGYVHNTQTDEWEAPKLLARGEGVGKTAGTPAADK